MDRPSPVRNGAPVMITKTKEWRFWREVMRRQHFGAIDFEQLDEILGLKLNQPVRRPHAIFVRRPWGQGKAQVLIDGRGGAQVAHRQHHMINWPSARHGLLSLVLALF